ncbi:Ig-like domain-containing protein, partial [Marivibrio halodurans]
AAGSTVTTQYGSLTVSANGDWSFTPVADVDNSNGNPTDGFSYTITDGDGDTSTAQQAIEITDGGEPIARDDGPDSGDGGASVAEGTNSVGGNVLDNDDAGADGGLEVVSFTYTDENGDEQSASAGDTVNTQYGELTVNGDGTWSYTSDASEDHSGGDLPDNFTYTVSDADGSTDSATQYITVTDGVPVAVNDETATVAEGAGPITGDVMANDSEGPDGATLTSFGYTDANGQAQTAAAGSTVTTQYGSLTVNGDGTWSFTPVSDVDNSNGNPTDGFSYTITDGDGDTSTAEQAIEITDGNAAQIDATDATVDEDDLSAGSDATPESTTVSGTFTQTHGTDAVTDVSFAGTVGLPTLYSDGVEITYALSGDGKTITGSAGGDTVFTATINANNSGYDFTLSKAIDHPAGQAQNSLTLPFDVTVTDSDGSTSQASFDVSVVDDVPLAAGEQSLNVSEDGGSIGTDFGAPNLLANDNLGADGGEITSFTYTDDNGQQQTGTVGQEADTQYGKLTVNADGSWSYTADEAANHDVTPHPFDSFTYTVTDADGDTSAGTQGIQLTDEGPSIDVDGGLGVGGDSFALDEDDVAGGTDGSDSTSVSGSLTIDGGADGIGGVSLEVPQALQDLNLTSGGQGLVYTLSNNGQTLTATAGAGGDTVFTVDLTESGGQYGFTFNLEGALDHANAAGENVLSGIPFGVAVTDTDGSTASATFTVDVVDDVPQAADEQTLTVSEGGQTIGTDDGAPNLLANDDLGADGAEITSFTYTDENGQQQTGTVGQAVDTQYGSLTVHADGNWSYTTNTSVDGDGMHDPFTYVITDGDGDIASATQDITIGDGGPELGFPGGPGDPLSDTSDIALDEDDLSPGGSDQSDAVFVTKDIAVDFGNDGPAANAPLVLEIPAALTAAGLTAGGQAITFALSGDGMSIIGSAGGDEVLSITLNGDPTNGYSYTATLSQPIDHPTGAGENVISNLPFTLVATDGDGSVARADITVDIVDDAPVANDEPAISMTEAEGGVGGNVLLNDAIGADGGTVTSFTYADENGQQQTVAAGSTVDTQYGQLTVNGDGSWTYTVTDDLDNVTTALEDGFGYTVTDSDGDTASAVQAISITDGGPQIGFASQPFGQPGGGSVDEDDLGSEVGDGETGTDGTGASSFTQAIQIDFGDDGPAATDPVRFEIPTELTNAGLTSGGEALSYSLSSDGLTVTATADGQTVFTATITGDANSGYSYSFDLVRNLDHPAGAGENAISDIPLTVVATDLDGDEARGDLDIQVVDDVPNARSETPIFVGEGGATIGTSHGAVNLFANDELGADAEGASLTSFTYTDQNGQQQTAAAGSSVDTQYGSLTVNANGTWSYTANGGLDHGTASYLEDSFSYTITDSDGDTDTAVQPIAVTDRGPTVDVEGGLGAQGDAFTIDEDDLTSGSDGSDATSVSGSLTIDGGTDGLSGVVLQVPQGLQDANLTSGGVPLTYSVSPDGQTITGSAGSDTIFTVTLGESGGQYGFTFDLQGRIDHPDGAGENAITNLPFEVKVTDTDGSEAVAGFTVDVVDDVPQAIDDATVSVVEGGNTVDGNVLDNDVEGADGASLTSFGYTDANGQAQTATAGSTVTTANGSLTVNGDGTWSFTPNASVDNTNGAVVDGFSYTITDGDGDTSTAQQAIEITDGGEPIARDDGPGAGDGGASVAEGSNSTSGNVLTNDEGGADGGLTVTGFTYTDENGDEQSASAGDTVNTQYGELTVNGDGTWSYTSDASEDHSGGDLPDNFTYTVSDADGSTDSATQYITVTDGVPVAVDDATVSVAEGTGPITGNVMG